MKREDYMELRYKLESAQRALEAACPRQMEAMGGGWSVSWSVTTESGRFRMDTGCEAECLTHAELRRLADIKEAGERWERNEGPWPMAKEAGK